MKIVVSTKDLKNAVDFACRAVPNKAATPILSFLLFKTSDNPVMNNLTIEGTDLNAAIQVRIPAEVEVSGSCAIHAKNLNDIVKKIGGSITTIEAEENLVTIKNNASRFELFAGSTEDFPAFKCDDLTNKFEMKTNDARRLIAHTAFAAADDDSRPIFQGVNFNLKDNIATAVCTNSHRLAVDSSEIFNLAQDSNIIVPAKILNNLAAMLPAENTFLKAEFNERAILFEVNNARILSRLIDGQFPPHEKVFHTSEKFKASIDIKELKGGLDRVNLIARNSNYHTVKLKLDREGLELTADSYDTGNVVEHLNANVDGKITIAFNINYVLDFLKATSAETLYVVGNEPLSPAKFTGDDSETFKYVITPVRI